jgi:aryl-alcohol dehydrogenase-like predicted oxidoreductase
MPTNTDDLVKDFTSTLLPVIEKPVCRMGIAGNCGLGPSDIVWAAEQGANYWVWGASFKKVTEGIKQVIRQDREKHVVAMLGWGLFGWQIRLNAENALRKLNTDYLDVFQLSWLGRMSGYRQGLIDTLLTLKQEGKIRAIGVSIHDRQRAGRLALDSEIDLFMIRYNAKHPGAEQDIFPYLDKRNPAIVSYTALAWQQLTRPLKGVDMLPLTPELCYRFALTNPHVHLVLTGPANREQLKQNFAALQQGPLTSEELSWVREYGRMVKSRKRLDYVR